jgi:hypothetical protein
MYEERHLARPTIIPRDVHILLFGMSSRTLYDIGASRANYVRP